MTQMFDIAEREVLYRVIASRRDMRHFLAGSTVAADVLRRILQAANTRGRPLA